MQASDIVRVAILNVEESKTHMVVTMYAYDADGEEFDKTVVFPCRQEIDEEDGYQTTHVMPENDEQKKWWDLCNDYWCSLAEQEAERY